MLHEGADGDALLAAIDGRSGEIDRERASGRWAPGLDGDTTYLCTVDGDGMGVSLIQSNASGFGSWLAEPNTGINLHNRGLGFSLEAGHPAELGPGKRPPHTLSPALATRDGRLASVFGTMGGDAQPQILLQVAARLFHHGQSPDRADPRGSLGAERPGHRLRHLDRAVGPDRRRRGPRARVVARTTSPAAATPSDRCPRSAARSATPTRSWSSTTASSPAPPTPAAVVSSCAAL